MVDNQAKKGYDTCMETLPSQLVYRIILAPEWERFDILYAYFEEIGAHFYKDTLHDIIDLIMAAYRLGIPTAS